MFKTILNHLPSRYHKFLDNELIQRIIKNSAYLFSGNGIIFLLSWVQGILSARMLGPVGLGILGGITQFTTVVNKFASFRMEELVVKYVGEYSEIGDSKRAASVFKIACLVEGLTSFFAYSLIFVLAPIGARFFAKDIDTQGWFILYGLVILANLTYESSTGFLQIFNRFRQISLLNAAQSVITLALIILAYVTSGDLLDVLIAYMAGKMIGGVGTTFIAWSEATRRWGSAWWKTPMGLLADKKKELVRFAVSTNISATLSLINKDSEILWVSAFRGPLEAGLYKNALALANLVHMPINPLPKVTYPELTREAGRKNWKNFRYILRQSSILAAAYTILASLALFFFGKPLIKTLYGEEYLPAYPALMILLIGFLVANTFFWNRSALLSLGLPAFPTKINTLIVFVKLIGAFLLLPRYGYIGSAILLAGTYILGVSLAVFRTHHELVKKETIPDPEPLL